jgi:hypothetical protein
MPQRFCVLASLAVSLLLGGGAGLLAQQPGEVVQTPNTTFVPRLPQPGPGGVPPPAPAPQAPARDRRADDDKPGTAIIRGQVVAADTGTPLRRAQIRVINTSGPGNATMAQTDAQGRFELTQLPAGRYNLTATRAGYVTMQFGQRAPNQPGTPIELADGQIADKVGFALVRGGAISGRIADEFGEPVSGAQVTVQRYASMGGVRRLTGGGGEGGFDRTDDLGQFRLYGLTPGEYYVTATLRTVEFMPTNTTAVASAMDGYAPTYFPGTPSIADARRVTVRAGQDVMNITFALSAAKVGRISGRVTTSTGAPAPGAMLMVTSGGDGMMAFTATGAPIRPDGTFQTGGLPPGNYTLTVQSGGNRFGGPADPNAEVARLEVPVNGEDVRDVQIVTGRGGIIRGRVVTDDGSVPTFNPQLVSVIPQPAEPGRPMMGMSSSPVRDDWTFELPGLVDRVRLRVSVNVPGGGWSIKGAFSNGIDFADAAADIGPGQVIDDVELVLTNKVTELTGVILDDRNQPVTDASVVLFTDNKASWTFGSRYLRTSRPDTTGKYSVRLTPADGYRAIVVRGLEEGQASDPEFLARALEHATPFEIREGEAKTLNLKVVEVK